MKHTTGTPKFNAAVERLRNLHELGPAHVPQHQRRQEKTCTEHPRPELGPLHQRINIFIAGVTVSLQGCFVALAEGRFVSVGELW
jgi:hypothetical protein